MAHLYLAPFLWSKVVYVPPVPGNGVSSGCPDEVTCPEVRLTGDSDKEKFLRSPLE